MAKGLLTLCVILIFADTPARADWVSPQSGQMPPNVVVVAGRFYVCRASFEGGIHPGVVGPSGSCDITYGENQYSVPNFEVLIDEGYSWAAVHYGGIPFDAFPAGKESQGEILYVCRGDVNAQWHPGKISETLAGCSIPYAGKELKAAWYEVLVRN